MTDTPVLETESEARARRTVHVIGAIIVLLAVGGVIWAVAGGAEWAKKRQLAAIQTVARADLELVAAAEAQFHKAHGFYTTDLKALNLWPKRVLYGFGFVKPASFKEATAGETGTETWDPEIRTIVHLAARRADDAIAKAKADPTYKPDAPIVLSPLTKITGIEFDRLASYCPDCTATKDTFKVIAVADLDSDPVLDVWTIDQTGAVRHLIDDLQ
ncbi:hypothetical protein BH10BDE1_BH10BDE1_24120 [soil metagenome]